MKLQYLKLFIMTKIKKNEFLEDFREISLVGSLKRPNKQMCKLQAAKIVPVIIFVGVLTKKINSTFEDTDVPEGI